jgi:peptidoglycan/xylan/chitin deacetylase (PgdA/CDA1 family)
VLAAAVRRGAALVGGPIDALRSARIRDGGVVVFIYHRVGRRTSSPVDLPLGVFADQLDRLLAHDLVLSLDAAGVRLAGGNSAAGGGGDSSAVLTFDDGTADWVDVVLPELVARRLPATFYVSTDFVESGRSFPDDGRPIGWSGLAEMVATGLVTVGSHTHTHHVLAGASAEETASELDRSVGLIEDRLGVPCRHFAYPKAIAGSSAAEVVVRRRFATAALAGNRINRPGATDLHRLGRHGLTAGDGPEAFARKVNGGAWLEGWLRERRDAAWS